MSRIVCLANSRKHGGRCIAGLRLDGGGWVRPVSDSPDGTLAWRHYRLDDGTDAQPLDELRIPLRTHVPQPHQPENWLIGQGRWELLNRQAGIVRPGALSLLERHLVSGPDLLGNKSNKVPFETLEEAPARASLALIAPSSLQWRITTSVRGRRQTRAVFTLSGQEYDLVVTDPLFEQRLSGLSIGYHPLPSAGVSEQQQVLLTVSLGEKFEVDNSYYKLAAAVIVLPR